MLLTQVQRRQVHKTAKDAEPSKSAKPTASPTAQRENKKDENKEKTKQKTLEQKMENLSLKDVEEVKKKPLVREVTDSDKDPTSLTGASFVKGHEPRDGPGTANIEGHSATERDQKSAEGQDGEDGDEDEVKHQLAATEEMLLKNLDFMKHESEDTRDKIKKLTSYMKVLETTPSEIHPEDKGTFPHQESQGNDNQGTSLMVSDMDPVAQAAIMASIQERERGDDFLQDEGEIMEPVQPSETDPNAVVVAGEIMGPQIHIRPIKSSHEEEVAVVTAVDRSPQSAIIPETKSTGDLQVDAMATTVTEHKPDPVVETKFAESDIQSAVATDESAPATHHSLSKKPKRQLAASFMNN